MLKNFDSLYESLLNELQVEVEPGYSGTGGEVEAKFPELAKGKYELTPEQTKDVFVMIVSRLKEDLGGQSPKLFEDFYKTEIAPLIKKVVPGMSNTNAKYAARILHNALRTAKVIRDERDGATGIKMTSDPSEEQVEKMASATVDAVETTEDMIEDEQPEVPVKTKTPTQATYSSNKDFYLKTREELPSGTLQGDFEAIYNRLESMAGSVTTGKDLEKALEQAGTERGRVSSYLRKMVETGILEPAEEDGDAKDIEALEADDEDMEKVEQDSFDKLFRGAYEDYLASSGTGTDY